MSHSALILSNQFHEAEYDCQASRRLLWRAQKDMRDALADIAYQTVLAHSKANGHDTVTFTSLGGDYIFKVNDDVETNHALPELYKRMVEEYGACVPALILVGVNGTVSLFVPD